MPHPYTTILKPARLSSLPYPLCTPYLGFAAMLMAGLDGVKTARPGTGDGQDLYYLPIRLSHRPFAVRCARHRRTRQDRSFLNRGVFANDFMTAISVLKMAEVIRFEGPHAAPVRIRMYYSAEVDTESRNRAKGTRWGPFFILF